MRLLIASGCLALVAMAVLGAGSWTPVHVTAEASPVAAIPGQPSQHEEQGGSPESNLPYLFAVYTITWVAFFAYALLMSRRQGDLRREVEALRRAMEEQEHHRGGESSPPTGE